MNLILLIIIIILALAIAGFFLAPKGMRTLAGNALMAAPLVLGEIAAQLTGFDWRSILTPAQASWVMLAIIVVNVVYRMKTTTPPGRSG